MIRVQLLQLYKNRHKDFKWVREQYPNEDMAGPFLMSPNALYSKQSIKLLIIGQETGGWHYHIDNLEQQMVAYEEFNVGHKYYSSPFWNVTRKVERVFENEPYSCAWTNLNKFDFNEGHAFGEFEAAISTVDDVLAEEINIIEPTVCLFFTGPSMDTRLGNIFKQLKFEQIDGFEKRELSRLIHPQLPKWSFRTYHPNFMRRQGKEEAFIKFIGTLRN
eukprot:gene4021-5751_t